MTQATQGRRIAVVLFNLGGPDDQASVKPFLFNLFNDPVFAIAAKNNVVWVLAFGGLSVPWQLTTVEAMQLVDRALAVDPNHVKALALKGSYAMTQRDFRGALKQAEVLALEVLKTGEGRLNVAKAATDAAGVAGQYPVVLDAGRDGAGVVVHE